MISLAREYLALNRESLPKTYVHPLDDDNVIYLTIIDHRHVFVAIAYKQDELPVQAFTERLMHLLPSPV
jgi:hypothetical protein